MQFKSNYKILDKPKEQKTQIIEQHIHTNTHALTHITLTQVCTHGQAHPNIQKLKQINQK